MNDLQFYCATERFLRSSKIAVQIGIDYAWNLRDLEEGQPLYDYVKEEFYFICKYKNDRLLV